MQLHRQAFTAMASPCELRVYAESAVLAQRAMATAEAEVRRIEAKYSRYRDDSVVSRINAAAGADTTVEVDTETAGLLDYAATVHAESEGLFDITSGVLRWVWDFRSEQLPKPGAVEAILPLIGWQHVDWVPPRIRLPLPGMQLDFGGFGKEYAVDRAAAILLEMGIASGIVDLGGDIRVLGPHPDGSPWRVGIRNPKAPEHPVVAVHLAGGAIATSGDYERAFLLDGKRYSHLLDPRSGWPIAGSPASASVLADRCLIAGSAATVAMLNGERAAEWLRALGLPWLTVSHDLAIDGNAVHRAPTG